MRGDPREQKIKVLLSQLRALGVEINNHTHQMIYDSKQKVKVDNTGVVD
jgi:hypothetical protein